MRTNFPIFCNSPEVSKDELVKLIHFDRPEAEIATLAGVPVGTVAAWKSGKKAVPVVVVRLLRLMNSRKSLDDAGPWTGATVEGTRLVLDGAVGRRLSIEFEELDRLPEYRRLYHLGTRQAELIERLMVERDFYRSNCMQASRYGMLLNSIFPPTDLT